MRVGPHQPVCKFHGCLRAGRASNLSSSARCFIFISSVKEHMSSRQTETAPTCHQGARRRCHQDAIHQPPQDPASLSAEQRPEPCDPLLCPPGPCLGSLPCLGYPQKTAIQSRIPVPTHSRLVEVHGRNSEASMLIDSSAVGPLGRLC